MAFTTTRPRATTRRRPSSPGSGRSPSSRSTSPEIRSPMTDITPAVRADLASTGKLRAAINYGNFILATKDRATGESRGVAVDLTQELGWRLGVSVEIVAYDSVAVMGDAAPTGAWDIAFLGSDPQREKLMSFTAAYLEIEATYLVRSDSPL